MVNREHLPLSSTKLQKTKFPVRFPVVVVWGADTMLEQSQVLQGNPGNESVKRNNK